jgi:hypothetical protein
MRKQIVFPLIVLIILAGAGWLWQSRHSTNYNSFRSSAEPPTNRPETSLKPDGTPLPKTALLKVPFTPQAPTANWDELHNEACEEASSLMAGLYFGGDTESTIPADKAEAEISKLVKWEEDNYGYHLDTTAAETAKMIEQVYGLKTKMLDNFTADDLKNQAAQNHLVLISTDGRLLGNPNYKRPGPPHHMLVVKGYDAQGIITNDSGTKNGRNYAYEFSTIYGAAGDWDHGKKAVDTNRKVAIIVWKE